MQDKHGKFLLLKRANTGYGDGKYSMPSGHLDGGESAIQAAAREAKEEVNVDIDPKDLKLIMTLHHVAAERDHERLDLFFEAKQWHGEAINAEPDKCTELLWANQDTLPKNVVPELTHFFKQLAANQAYGDYNF